VCRADQRGALLELAAVGGWPAVELCLAGLRAIRAAVDPPTKFSRENA
jgi:hypothetical protein